MLGLLGFFQPAYQRRVLRLHHKSHHGAGFTGWSRPPGSWNTDSSVPRRLPTSQDGLGHPGGQHAQRGESLLSIIRRGELLGEMAKGTLT